MLHHPQMGNPALHRMCNCKEHSESLCTTSGLSLTLVVFHEPLVLLHIYVRQTVNMEVMSLFCTGLSLASRWCKPGATLNQNHRGYNYKRPILTSFHACMHFSSWHGWLMDIHWCVALSWCPLHYLSKACMVRRQILWSRSWLADWLAVCLCGMFVRACMEIKQLYLTHFVPPDIAIAIVSITETDNCRLISLFIFSVRISLSRASALSAG